MSLFTPDYPCLLAEINETLSLDPDQDHAKECAKVARAHAINKIGAQPFFLNILSKPNLPTDEVEK